MQKISSASINYNAQWATSPHTHTCTHNKQEKCLYCTHKSVLNCFTAGAQRERMLTLPLHVTIHCKCLRMCRWTKEQDQTKSLTIGACMHLYFCTTCLQHQLCADYGWLGVDFEHPPSHNPEHYIPFEPHSNNNSHKGCTETCISQHLYCVSELPAVWGCGNIQQKHPPKSLSDIIILSYTFKSLLKFHFYKQQHLSK